MNAPNHWMTITTPLFRVRSQHVTLQTTPPEAPPVLLKPLRLARILAMAHVLDAQLASGELENFEAATQRYRVSKARISQILDLLLLAPDIQEQILFWTNIQGHDPISEREMRSIFNKTCGDWAAQRLAWEKLLAARGVSSPFLP